MCLSQTANFKVSETEIGIGYKWVTKAKGVYYSSNFSDRIVYKQKVWNKAKWRGLSECDVGFHIYDDYEDAVSSWYAGIPMIGYHSRRDKFIKHRKPKAVLIKVRYKNFHTGEGDGDDKYKRMIVAMDMQIIKEVKLNNKKQE